MPLLVHRRIGEGIVIGSSVLVTIVAIRRDKVKLKIGELTGKRFPGKALSLCCKKNERLLIDGRATLTILEIRAKTTRVAIVGSRDVNRQEVFEAIHGKAATRSPWPGRRKASVRNRFLRFHQKANAGPGCSDSGDRRLTDA